MVARWVSVAGLWLAAGVVPLACSGEPYNIECGSTEGCGTSSQVTDATLPDCSKGPCTCEDPDKAACCPFGWPSCDADVLKCRPKAECGIEGIPCGFDADCPGPPDHRCGVGRCEEGECKLDILAWEFIPNQYPGDCKATRCSTEGDLEVVTDLSDVPDDGNPCTYDTCEGDELQNQILPDAVACPGEAYGVCWMGICRECAIWLNVEECPPNLACKYQWCVPPGCANDVPDGEETHKDCGGPDCHSCGGLVSCNVASDCTTGVCEMGMCQEPRPDDGVKNGEETGVDCGHPGGAPCQDGEGCTAAIYCTSGVCYKGLCQEPSCTDSIKNGSETGPDCGGECSPCLN